MYNVKLSNNAIENLRNLICGLSDGKINLTTGVIQVESKEDVQKIAQKFGIDNVNYKPYKQFIGEVAETTLEERNQIIGYNLEVGSVIRLRGEHKTVHAVITAVNGKKYTAAQLVLSKATPKADGTAIVYLEKGKDIVYRNMTYSDVVTLTSKMFYDLQWRDFIKGSGGMIVGKVTNLKVINQISDCSQNNGNKEKEEAPSHEEPAAQPDNAHDDGKKEGINFLRSIEESETLDELFDKLGVASDILKAAATECIETGRSNLKKLIPVLQAKYEKAYGRLSQSAIKNKMNDEVQEWCESHNVDMEENSVSYFLKAIVKGLKKS